MATAGWMWERRRCAKPGPDVALMVLRSCLGFRVTCFLRCRNNCCHRRGHRCCRFCSGGGCCCDSCSWGCLRSASITLCTFWRVSCLTLFVLVLFLFASYYHSPPHDCLCCSYYSYSLHFGITTIIVITILLLILRLLRLLCCYWHSSWYWCWRSCCDCRETAFAIVVSPLTR